MRQEDHLCCNVNKKAEMIVRVDYLTTLSQSIHVEYLLIIKCCKKKYAWRSLS